MQKREGKGTQSSTGLLIFCRQNESIGCIVYHSGICCIIPTTRGRIEMCEMTQEAMREKSNKIHVLYHSSYMDFPKSSEV